MPRPNQAHHKGDYPKRAAAVRAAAYADPSTRCRRCGRTLAEVLALGWTPRQAGWQGGHAVDGQVGGPLVPEHARCNETAGARLGGLIRQRQLRQQRRRRSPNA